MLRRLRERRLFRRLARDEAARLQPLTAEVRAELDLAAHRVRDAGAELPAYSPACPACGRGMRAERHQLSKKKWRWVWRCRGERCYGTLPYSKVTIETPSLDV